MVPASSRTYLYLTQPATSLSARVLFVVPSLSLSFSRFYSVSELFRWHVLPPQLRDSPATERMPRLKTANMAPFLRYHAVSFEYERECWMLEFTMRTADIRMFHSMEIGIIKIKTSVAILRTPLAS